MASLLSVASQSGSALPGRKRVRRLLEDDDFRSIERSELASEAGTLEIRNGSNRPGLRMLQAALATPTDNSLAQVEWVSRRFRVLDVDFGEFVVPFPDEALARSAAQEGAWHDALTHAERWMDDQPFDSGAAVLGSYVASIGLEDWTRAAEIARAGLLASPDEGMLRNNLAFALIEAGDLETASTELTQVSTSGLRGEAHVALLATQGLLAFRSGNAVQGNALYRSAISEARRARDADAEAMALSMLIRETARIGDLSTSQNLLEELARASRSAIDTGVRLAITRALRLADAVVGEESQ